MSDKVQAEAAQQEERRTWERPQVKRMVAGEAEASGGGSTDLGVLS